MDAKRRMGEAMGRLLTKKPLKCISVEELVRESGVTRDAYDRTFASMTELAHYEFLHILAVHGRDILGSKSWSEALRREIHIKSYEDSSAIFRVMITAGPTGALSVSRLCSYAAEALWRTSTTLTFSLPEMVVYGGEETTMRWMMDGMKVPLRSCWSSSRNPICFHQYLLPMAVVQLVSKRNVGFSSRTAHVTRTPETI